MSNKFFDLFKGFFDSEKVGGVLLLFCTVISLSIANSPIGESYVQLMHTRVDLSFANASLNYSIEQWVNDGLMAIFFLMVGLEVEREIYVGELSDIKKAILPVAAAVGGMVVPSLIHFILNKGTPSQAGFAIPMATDIAFALGVLALAGNKIPTSVKVFLAALAIIDDIGAIVVIAFFYTKTIFFMYLLVALAIFCLLLTFNRMRVTNLVFYLLPGLLMWYCFLQSGVHATLSGVLLAFAVPFNKKDEKNVSLRLQHFLHRPVAFIIIPVFALVNTAIILPRNFIESIVNTNSAGIILGLFVGKVAGIVSFPYLLIKAGKATLQEGISLQSLTGIGFLGGIGFTMSMFISNLAFDNHDLMITSKLSILIGSALSAVTGLLIVKRSVKT
ncbi:Na+/H+ antiporter NhaA [Segetibacter sp.]|jgi:NhaA family Na+:H+ antiporter|uniref:Na+/H+ antiporter NhaA n=1 Tax=Segetibacter sp. TaxID=2231182 RepID=UPI00260F70C2|nr:Na+/H+ antiporter NhaA [Segetibacter sp.]MCW3080679.1 nhaA [Segetibacter sp.]